MTMGLLFGIPSFGNMIAVLSWAFIVFLQQSHGSTSDCTSYRVLWMVLRQFDRIVEKGPCHEVGPVNTRDLSACWQA